MAYLYGLVCEVSSVMTLGELKSFTVMAHVILLSPRYLVIFFVFWGVGYAVAPARHALAEAGCYAHPAFGSSLDG